MDIQDNFKKYLDLRKAYPLFVFESFLIENTKDEIRLEFEFRVDPGFVFRPTMVFPFANRFKNLPQDLVSSLAFHIGMVEMISYWKAFCSPGILLKPFRLSNLQEQWWKKLFRYGLGEFFYTNGIELPGEDLLEFSYPENAAPFNKHPLTGLINDAIIPIGGGKDSIISLELLKKMRGNHLPLVMNHRGATLEVLDAGGFNIANSLEVKRNLDPLLLELNARGFLNGHTPFSALLAFMTLLAAALTGKKYIVLSNESSANEVTIPGTKINHQYSKSFEFEQDFRNYINLYLLEGINYFSFLRPLNELQIAALFVGFKQYHQAFKSCNVGSKSNIWCCNCSKCLFTWIILDPFLSEKELEKIFGENLYEKATLEPILDQLTGVAQNKPFECVGTTEEVIAALNEGIKKRGEKELPVLLKHFKQKKIRARDVEDFLREFHSPHALEQPFVDILKEALSQIRSNS